MSQQPVIDGFEFASTGAVREGIWPVGDFPRLHDMVASNAGEVAYEVRGMRDERGRPALRVNVRGTLALRCQRCLEPMAFEVKADATLVLAATIDEIHAEPADVHAPDRVVGGPEMPLRDLIEDELILAIPYAPRHERCLGPEADVDERTLPFAGLRGLMRGKH